MTAFVLFHVMLEGALACTLRHERPGGPFVPCLLCRLWGPR